MDNLEFTTIEHIIRSQIGTSATCERYDRTIKTPMNFVLDEVEKQLPKNFIVYWVTGGIPELFCLPDLSPTPVVYNSRYVELVYLMQRLIQHDALANLRGELTERICLKVMAEFSLRYGSVDLAVLAFLKSVVGQSVFIPDTPSVDLQDLELLPINEPYMATWFFGLVHELGHSMPYPANQYAHGPFSDNAIQQGLESAFNQMPFLKELKQETLIKAKERRAGYALGIDHLRTEGWADIFATQVLFQTTFDIMSELKGKPFRIEQFIANMIICLNIVVILDRCKQMAVITSTSPPDPIKIQNLALQPVSFHVRMLMVQYYLAGATASFISDSDRPSREKIDQCYHLIDQVKDQLIATFNQIEDGMAHATRFAFFPQERERDLMTRFAHQIMKPDAFLHVREAEQFCNLADSLGAKGELLEVLARIVGSASQR